MAPPKGNKYATVNKGVPKHEFIDGLLEFVVGGGARKAKEALEELADGKKISDERKLHIDYLLKFLPYKKPQLARQEIVGKDGDAIRLILDK